MKKIWKRPMLQVLTRGKQEELVLDACKGDFAHSSLGLTNDGCRTIDACASQCDVSALS